MVYFDRCIIDYYYVLLLMLLSLQMSKLLSLVRPIDEAQRGLPASERVCHRIAVS